MRITKLRKQIPVSLALIALSILAVPAVKAQCGASARVNGTWTQDNLTSPGVSPRGFILMVRQREPELLPDSNTRFRCRSEAVYEGQATLSAAALGICFLIVHR
jgi:hypothetical protein